MPNYSDETIYSALESIQRRYYVLPAIQREFVWDVDQICALFDSLMRDYPINSFLYWKVAREHADDYRWYDFVLNYHEYDSPGCPPHQNLPAEDRIAVLDGQQRLTALNIGMRGSHAKRTKHRRVGRPQNYPRKFLYLDICAEPRLSEDRYEDQVYRFEFLEPEAADELNTAQNGSRWFRVGEILKFPQDAEAGMRINSYLRERELADHPQAYSTLFRLWRAIFQQRHVSYYTEADQSLDRVLDIFIRVNSQGQPLSKSDLLMSVATAQWEGDAREEIPSTVRRVNATPPGYNFSRDNILKAGLVIAGASDVRFRAETFNRENMRQLETKWETISTTVCLAAELFSSFGLSRENISARVVLIPVAYYLHRRDLGDRYLSDVGAVADRQRVRDWTIRALLMPGVFGSGVDTLLGRLRRVIDDYGDSGFPTDPIENAMAGMGKTLRFAQGTVDELVNAKYGRPETFALLSILYGNVDPSRAYHIDHIFPRAMLRLSGLREAGYGYADIEYIIDKARDGLANLQLLPGAENLGKSAQMPFAWASQKYADQRSLAGYLEQNDMADLPQSLDGFRVFFDARRERLRARLLEVLGREPGSLAEPIPGV
jgi:hypothetical protein